MIFPSPETRNPVLLPDGSHQRFALEIIAALQGIGWWDWDMADIVANESAIVDADLDALRQVASNR